MKNTRLCSKAHRFNMGKVYRHFGSDGISYKAMIIEYGEIYDDNSYDMLVTISKILTYDDDRASEVLECYSEWVHVVKFIDKKTNELIDTFEISEDIYINAVDAV